MNFDLNLIEVNVEKGSVIFGKPLKIGRMFPLTLLMITYKSISLLLSKVQLSQKFQFKITGELAKW